MKIIKVKLRTKYILYIVFVHIIFIALSFPMLNQNRILFVLAEFFILFSIFLSLRLYNIFIKPINLISSGIDMLKDKDFNTRLSPTGQMEIDSLINIYNKMIDQLREERIKQIEQNFFLEKLIYASPSGIIVLDMDCKVASINPAALNMMAIPEDLIIGKRLNEIGSRLSQEIVTLENGKPGILNLSGNQIYRCYKLYSLDQGFQRYFYVIEEMTKEVLKTERKAYEKVVRMMSHEINNSIGAVNSFLQSFINYKSQLHEDDQEDFENSLNIAIERNIRLNRFMSNFSNIVKIPEPNKESVDLDALLLNAEKIFSNECRSRNISWEWQFGTSPFIVKMDILQMEQVIYNIIKNAIEAIETDGTITVITENNIQKKLIVRDNGTGISNEMRSQIFTPFFSTKTNGQGIGLTFTKEVLLNHNFNFSLETSPQGFTEFQIYFQ